MTRLTALLRARLAISRTPVRAPRPLRVLLAACLLALVPGCTSDEPDPLVVLGPLTGAEGEAFEAALQRLDDGTGRTYAYEGTRSLRETLVSQLEADTPPDVAVLNSVGELTEYARRGKLRPIAERTTERAFLPWAPTLLVDGKRRTYWVPLKVDLKSLVWSEEGASSDDPAWCVGLASQATSGWPGTDWIEDILLHQAGPDPTTNGPPAGSAGTTRTSCGPGRPGPGCWRAAPTRPSSAP